MRKEFAESVRYEIVDLGMDVSEVHIRKEDVGEWIFSEIRKLREHGIMLLTAEGMPLKVEEREKSIGLWIGNAVAYVPKSIHSAGVIRRIFERGEFTDLLVREDKPFFMGFIFRFAEMPEKEYEIEPEEGGMEI